MLAQKYLHPSTSTPKINNKELLELFEPLNTQNSAIFTKSPYPKMSERLIDSLPRDLKKNILQIGMASGYLTARLAVETEKVSVIEENISRCKQVINKLQSVDLNNIKIKTGNGENGWSEQAPYDAIIYLQRLTTPPTHLLDQLRVGGSIYYSTIDKSNFQELHQLTKNESGIQTKVLIGFPFIPKLGDLLLQQQVISNEQLKQYYEDAAKAHLSLGHYLQHKSLVNETQLKQAWALCLGISFSSYGELIDQLSTKTLNKFSANFMKAKNLIPLNLTGTCLAIATPNPDAIAEQLANELGVVSLTVTLVTTSTYNRVWNYISLHKTLNDNITSIVKADKRKDVDQSAPVDDYSLDYDLESITMPVGQGLDQNQKQANKKKDEITFENLTIKNSSDHDEEIIKNSYSHKQLKAIFLEAISDRASDIHLESYGDQVRVRIRVDGQLRVVNNVKLTYQELDSITNIIKVLSDLDISERRRPQGGHFTQKIGKNAVEVRVQTQPSKEGEYIIMRLIGQQSQLLEIDKLGMPEIISKQYRRLIENPGGLILITGATGSGKSTTLNAALIELEKAVHRKIITVEDPVECHFKGIQQTSINSSVGYTFSEAIRHLVRQDPDVIIIGEIRDKETALEAIRASQTGHLVLATLHSNDTTDSIQRLYDLDIHPNSISSELIAVISQRLARRICTSCKTKASPSTSIIEELNLEPDEVTDYYQGKGCVICSGHGHVGRVVVPEYLPIGRAVRHAISRKLSTDGLRKVALQSQLITMRDSFLSLVKSGTIDINEARQILSEERMKPELDVDKTPR